MVLTDLDEGALSFYEWFIYCWTATFILEEIRQVKMKQRTIDSI